MTNISLTLLVPNKQDLVFCFTERCFGPWSVCIIVFRPMVVQNVMAECHGQARVFTSHYILLKERAVHNLKPLP